MKDRPSTNENLLDIDLENTMSIITYDYDTSSRLKRNKRKSFKIKPMVIHSKSFPNKFSEDTHETKNKQKKKKGKIQ